MTGAEFAAARVQRGYTQGALAQVLGVSTATVARMEGAPEVPAGHAQVLLGLPPAPGGSRGPYKAGKAASAARKAPPPLPRRQRATPAPAQSQAQAAPQASPLLVEEVLEADAIGAVLLEGADLRRYWGRVATWRQWLLAKRRQQRGGSGTTEGFNS